MQPDMDAINDAIDEYYWDSWHKVFQITSLISLVRPNAYSKCWYPTEMLKKVTSCRFGKKGEVISSTVKLQIDALGRRVRCALLGFHPTNMTRENWQLLEEQGLIFDVEKHKPFNMDNCLCMDIETCSLINTGGRFLVHNVGWGHTHPLSRYRHW